MTGRAPLVVVGNPDNRRVTLFRAAAAEAGVPTTVLPWRQLAAAPVRLPRQAVVRIDSPGEDAEVDRLLRGAGRPAEHGEIVGLAPWYAGLRAALDRLGEAVHAAGATLLNQPSDVLGMFDKRACHARLSAAGVLALQVAPGRIRATTSVELSADGRQWRAGTSAGRAA
jgi:hypothetical protein